MCRYCGWLYFMKHCPECKANYYCDNCFQNVGGCKKCSKEKCIRCNTSTTLQKCTKCNEKKCNKCITDSICIYCKLDEVIE